jgi:hypothetical protein
MIMVIIMTADSRSGDGLSFGRTPLEACFLPMTTKKGSNYSMQGNSFYYLLSHCESH